MEKIKGYWIRNKLEIVGFGGLLILSYILNLILN